MDNKLPSWIENIFIPMLNLFIAFCVSAMVFLWISIDPIDAVQVIIAGALGEQEYIGYTLYYTTNFIFTGIAVAIAFYGGLFNIGGEGQAYIGGLGIGLVCLAFDHILPSYILLPLAMIVGMLFGALWAFIPGVLQAYRDSHIVITTIMFNFISSSLMVYLMVYVLKAKQTMSPVSRYFEESAFLPTFSDFLALFGIHFSPSPLNISFLIAILLLLLFWLFLYKSRWGYAIRTIGMNPQAAEYAGINRKKMTVYVMLLSGACAGLLGMNEIAGFSHQIRLDFVAGYGFTGIAVALIGKNHPIGIFLSALLFGVLYQGGNELVFFDIDREMVVVIQALIVLFAGAFSYMTVKPVTKLYFYFFSKLNNKPT